MIMKMFNSLMRLGAITLMLSPLTACNDGSSSDSPRHNQTNNTTATEAGHTANDRDSFPAGLGCGWEFASNIDTMNIAFPDESAKYWVALVPMLPETRLRIDGYYPDARYFSFNVYDPLLRPTDAIADVEIQPQDGGHNSFTDPQVAYGDAYTAYVDFSAAPEDPAERAANTVYAGQFNLGPAPVPQVLMTGLIYRIYVPGEDKEFDGGVGLPLLTLETADGETELLPTANCVEPLLPTLGDSVPSLGVNDGMEGVDFIDDPFIAQPGAIPVGTREASTNVFYGLPSTAFNLMRGLLGLPIPEGVEDPLPLPAGGGFLSNIHNAYTTNLFTRNYGNVVMIRAKAPSYRGGTAFGEEQLRYWSICQNDLPTQRYVGCVADYQAHLDDQGYFTVMVSDEADRPVNAVAENGIDWLAWGPYFDALLIYRHMLQSDDFAQAIHNVPKGTPPIEIMGEYMPQSAYCLPEIVEAAGDNPADIFAACKEYTEGL